MMEALLQIDYNWLIAINKGLSNSFFDAVMPWWRDKLTWIPLYLALLAWFIWRFRRKFWIPSLMLIMTVGLCDFTAASIIKPEVQRLRPCNNPEVADDITVRIDCGPGYSFPSAHATNHFGIAVFLIMLFWKKHRKWLIPVGLFWAASISIGQVYVGVHYPFDIIAGAFIGSIFGFTLGYPANRIINPKPRT